jgi:MFS family permease
MPLLNVDTSPHIRRNFLVHTIEGGLVGGGMAFIAADTIAPPLIKSLGGATWLISLMPILFTLGILLPPLFTAHRVEHLRRFKPLVLITALMGRALLLTAGLVLLFITGDLAGLAIAVVVGAQFFSGLCNGITLSAWQALVAKTIPLDKIPPMWASRNTISALLGILGGGAISLILAAYPGFKGFGVLYLIACGFGIAAAIVFSLLHEPPSTKPPIAVRSLGENLRRVPAIVTNDPRLRNFLLSTACVNGVMIMVPFMSLHGLSATGTTTSFLGLLVSGQMAGGIAGNVAAGFLGSRYGAKVPMLVGRILFLIVGVVAIVAHTQWHFLAVFVLYGMGVSCNLVGTSTMNITLSPTHDRTTYLSIMSTIAIPSMLIASTLSTVLWNVTGNFTTLAVATLLTVTMSIFFLGKIDTRQTG